jgi:hypothetical protein
MSAGFPQFCTMCEKQIMTPNVSVLYCSQHCRLKDTNKPLADAEGSLPEGLFAPSAVPETPPPPRGARGSLTDATPPPPDIVPRHSPTPRLPNSLSFSSPYSLAEIAVQAHSAMPTLVTEYSYNTHTDLLIERDADGNRPGHRRQQSEAAKYLRLFHTPSALVDSHAPKPFGRPVPPTHRASTTSLAPSLSFSSLTYSPSPGTSPASMTARQASLPDTRPLPPRRNPYSTSYGAKSIQLVSPFAAAASLPVDVAQSLPVDVPRPTPIDVPRPLLPHTPSSDRLPMLKSLPSVGTEVGVESLPNVLPYGHHYSLSPSNAESIKGGLAGLFRFAAMQAPPTPP